MKKTLLILALAFVMVLGLGVAPAFAKYAGYSATKQYVPWAEATSLASQNVDAALEAFGPHNGYATTTIKCAVCHSVHRGSTKLLNRGSACAYCHTNAYYGGGAVAPVLVSWNANASAGPHSSFCSGGAESCHAGPHGVGASAYAGPSSKLLETDDVKLVAFQTANGVPLSALDTWDGAGRVLGTAATCGRCHENSALGIVTAGTALDIVPGPSGVTTATGHRVIATASDAGLTGWNANQTDFPSGKTGLKIAYKPVDYCNSCHDLTDDNLGNKLAFPHGNTDVVSAAQDKIAGKRAAVWLTAGADADSQTYAVGPYNQYTATSTVTRDQAGSSILDGVCLKCHRSATAGLGRDF